MGKKSMIQSELLKYILIVVTAFLIILFAIILIKNLSEKQREAELIGFKSDIKKGIEVIATRFGSVDEEQFILLHDTDLVCFIDVGYRNEILETPLVDKYLFIKSSLESKAEENIFLISNDELQDVLYVEDLCFDDYPHHQCVEASFGQIDLLLEGMGDCTTIHIDYTVYISDNIRNKAKYELIENGGFLAKETADPQNYNDVLRVIPLAFVNNKTSYNPYPYLVYHGNIDDTKIKTIMQTKEIDAIIIFRGNPYNEYNINGYTVIDETFNNYLSYWETIYDVTIIGNNNEDGALIASLFAAFTNTPLIFISKDNLNEYKPILSGKKVNVVDENSIDNEVIEYIEDAYDIEVRYFKSSDLRILNRNRIIKLDSEISIP